MTHPVQPSVPHPVLNTLPSIVALLVILLLTACAGTERSATPDDTTKQRFEIPRRSTVLTPEQEKVRQQATLAVESDIDGYLGRYIEHITTKRDRHGRILVAGTQDLEIAMTRGPLTISADDMRGLFPQYARSAASRSVHSVSVHEAVTAMAKELYRRALAIQDPRGNNAVLFTAGGVASGKTTAIHSIEVVGKAAYSAQIVYDSTMRRHASARPRVLQALEAGKMVNIIYVYTPIERSARWLVQRAVESGRVVPADAAARSHWQSQSTFLQLLEEFDSNRKVSFLLIDNSGDRPLLAAPSSLREKHYANSGRFKNMQAFIAYVRGLVRSQLYRWKAENRLLPETEAAFGIVD